MTQDHYRAGRNTVVKASIGRRPCPFRPGSGQADAMAHRYGKVAERFPPSDGGRPDDARQADQHGRPQWTGYMIRSCPIRCLTPDPPGPYAAIPGWDNIIHEFRAETKIPDRVEQAAFAYLFTHRPGMTETGTCLSVPEQRR